MQNGGIEMNLIDSILIIFFMVIGATIYAGVTDILKCLKDKNPKQYTYRIAYVAKKDKYTVQGGCTSFLNNKLKYPKDYNDLEDSIKSDFGLDKISIHNIIYLGKHINET